MGMTAWPDEDIAKLRRMLAEGKPSHEIAEALGRKPSSVRRYVNYNKHRMNLVVPVIQGRGDVVDMKEFNKKWQGSVPFGHWALTKPWRVSK